MSGHSDFKLFLEFSAAITGYSQFQLQGTGQAELYFSTLIEVVGAGVVSEMLGVYRDIASHEYLDEMLKQHIFADARWGPIARNVIKLWYVGTWYQLDKFPNAVDFKRIVSPIAYTEGLLWRTIGANPSGAKAPGYGSWANPPTIPPT
ncbi:MAG: hypothetical protein JWP89_5439 [Schlesneria sp.]|nr:hypothetical protein [Schlesneria sp.]